MHAADRAPRLNELPDPSWRLLLRRGLPQFALETVVPVLAFYAGWREFGLGGGVVLSTLVSFAVGGYLLQSGRETRAVVLGLVFVAIQAAVGLAAHSTAVYLAQPVVFSTLLALAYAGSVALGRPLIGVFASVWYPFPRWFRESRPFRREFGLQTLVWAALCLLRAGLRLWTLLHAGVGGFVLVSVVTGVPPYAVLVAWGIWHARRVFGRLGDADFGFVMASSRGAAGRAA